MSEVAWAMAPLAAAATACPVAHARLPRPNASPWFSSTRCAPALSSDIAGANSVPNAGMPTISRAMSSGAGSATGASRLSTTAAASDSRTGTSSPRRSDSRPASGDSPASIAADARKVAPMSRALAPSRLSRSGASTSSTPNAIPATVVSHMPSLTGASRSAGQAARSPCGAAPAGAGTTKAVTMSMAPPTAAAENAGPVPTWLATAPTTGPNSAPPTAAPIAMPSSSPRRSAGATVVSQARPAAQVHAPPRPWTKRAASRTPAADDQPKSRVDVLINASPSSVTRLAPRRDVSSPPGSAPTRVPSGYAATRIPAPAFDSPAECT